MRHHTPLSLLILLVLAFSPVGLAQAVEAEDAPPLPEAAVHQTRPAGYRSQAAKSAQSCFVLRADVGATYYSNPADHTLAGYLSDVTAGFRLVVGSWSGRHPTYLSLLPEVGFAYQQSPEKETNLFRAGLGTVFHLLKDWVGIGPVFSFLVGTADHHLSIGARATMRVDLLQRILVLEGGYEYLHGRGYHHAGRFSVGIDVWAVVHLGVKLVGARSWPLL
jgi:hypothetical protein